jgi:hypothetical protein
MTRSVYILDQGNGNTNTVVLHVYKRVDTLTITGGVTSDVETIEPHGKVVLSLQSQIGATCYMAANDTSVFVSTNANDQASLINKETLVETVFTQQFINVGPVSQITAANGGIVFITFGTGPTAGWAEFNDASDYLATGESYNFTVLAGTTNATTF